MRRAWAILIVVLLVLGAASFVAARLVSQRTPSPLESEPGLVMLQSYLDLSREQQAKLKPIDAQFADSRAALRERVWQSRDRFLAAIRNSNTSDKEVVDALREFAAARDDMAVNTIEYVLSMRKVLNTEQRAKLVSLMDRGVCGMTGGPGMGGKCMRRGEGACGLGILGGKGDCPAPGARRGGL